MKFKTKPVRIPAAWLGVLLAGIFSIPILEAQESKIVKSISVRYVGVKTVSEQRILAKMSSKVGAPLSIYQVDEDIKSLSESGDVINARFLSEEVPGGVKLIVVVECSSLYGGVRFEGNTIFSEKRLAKNFELPLNRPIDRLALQKSRQEVVSLYRKKGYPEATIDYRIDAQNSRGIAKVTVVIDEKKPGVLRKVSFAGNSAISAEDLKGVMEQKERGIKNLIGGGGRTDPESIANDIRGIEAHYRDCGYFDARVTKVAKIPVDTRFNDLRITISEGRVFNISEITVNGVNVLSANKDLIPFMKTKAGNSFSGSDLRDDIKMITEAYRSRGHIDAEVVPRLEDSDQD